MHTNFTHRLRAGLVALALTLGLLGVAVHRADAAEVCHEDQPCWDCETMGNRICGPIPVPAEPRYTG